MLRGSFSLPRKAALRCSGMRRPGRAVTAAAALAATLLAERARADESEALGGDAPLTPRKETEDERAARGARPRFRKPSELSRPESVGRSAESPSADGGTTLPAIPPLPPEPRTAAHYPAALQSRAIGPYREWWGEPFLARPPSAPPLAAAPASVVSDPIGQLFARGSYSYISGPLRDWTAIEVAASADVASGVAVSASYRHELREESGDLVAISASTPIRGDYRLVGTLVTGYGADFFPLVQLAGELRGPIPGSKRVHFGAGGGASWWTGARRQFEATLAGVFWNIGGVSGEQRMHVRYFISDSAPGRALPGLSTTLHEGTPGKTVLEQRVSVAMLPRYGARLALEDAPTEPTVDVSLSLREWLGADYGFIFAVEFGTQRGAYSRVGADVSMFVSY